MPSKEYVVFPGALSYPLEKLDDGDYETASVELKKTDWPQEYYGKTTMVYQFDGNYSFVFLSSEEVSQHNAADNPYGTKQSSHFYLDELKGRIHPDTDYNVGTSDLTAQLRNNAITLSITFILVAFAVIELREQVFRIVNRIETWRASRRSNP